VGPWTVREADQRRQVGCQAQAAEHAVGGLGAGERRQARPVGPA